MAITSLLGVKQECAFLRHDFITLLFDFPTLTLRFADVSMAEILLQVVYTNTELIHHLFEAVLQSRH